MTSKLFRINLTDVQKGIFTALATAIVVNLTTIIGEGWPTPAELLDSLRLGLYAAGGYIIKNIFTNSDGQVLRKEQ